jgi:hypothetical protein
MAKHGLTLEGVLSWTSTPKSPRLQDVDAVEVPTRPKSEDNILRLSAADFYGPCFGDASSVDAPAAVSPRENSAWKVSDFPHTERNKKSAWYGKKPPRGTDRAGSSKLS